MNGGSLWKPWRNLCLKKPPQTRHFSKPYLQPTKFLKPLVTGLIPPLTAGPRGSLESECEVCCPLTSSTLSALFYAISTPAPPTTNATVWGESPWPLQLGTKEWGEMATQVGSSLSSTC